MNPYSSDLRQKIIDAYQNQEGSIRKLAQRFKVSPSFINTLLQRYRNDGTIKPKPHAGGPEPRLKTPQLEVLEQLVEQNNDATLEQLADGLYERTQIRVSPATIHRALKKLNLTRKKKTFKASEAYAERVQKLRCEYWDQIRDVAPENLVFLDEAGVNLAMALLYARASKGQRAYSERPEKKGKNVTLIGAIALSGLIASLSFDGATNGDTFLFFIEHVLCPQLWPGAVVVMDNLSSHKVPGVREALESVGASVVYLSPYSPDFNPIENCWSKVKAALRKMAARTRESLDDAISDALNLVSLTDIRNWFAHGCYCTTPA